MRRTDRLSGLGGVVAALGGVCGLAAGQVAGVASWTNPAGGAFGDAANWDSGMAPGVVDTARFDLDAGFGVGFGGAAVTSALELGAGDVSFGLGGFDYQLNDALAIGAGDGEDATLRIGDGRLVSPLDVDIHVGTGAGSRGALIVSGAGAVVELQNFDFPTGAIFGRPGELDSALLRVEDGGLYTDAGAAQLMSLYGTGEVSGAGSRFNLRTTQVFGSMRVDRGATANSETWFVGGAFAMDLESVVTAELDFLMSSASRLEIVLDGPLGAGPLISAGDVTELSGELLVSLGDDGVSGLGLGDRVLVTDDPFANGFGLFSFPALEGGLSLETFEDHTGFGLVVVPAPGVVSALLAFGVLAHRRRS